MSASDTTLKLIETVAPMAMRPMGTTPEFDSHDGKFKSDRLDKVNPYQKKYPVFDRRLPRTGDFSVVLTPQLLTAFCSELWRLTSDQATDLFPLPNAHPPSYLFPLVTAPFPASFPFSCWLEQTNLSQHFHQTPMIITINSRTATAATSRTCCWAAPASSTLPPSASV
jgi:hypothetical protein